MNGENCGNRDSGSWVCDRYNYEKICRKGRVVLSDDDINGEYRCDGTRFQRVTFTSGDTPKEPEP